MKGPRPKPALQRFWRKVQITTADGCWLWTAGTDRDGYGQFFDGNRTVAAHRFAYELFIGPIPSRLVLDHLCRVRECVRPDHLEPTTKKINILRGVGACAINARKRFCIRGHALFGPNLHVKIDSRGRRQRHCRACRAWASRGLYRGTAAAA